MVRHIFICILSVLTCLFSNAQTGRECDTTVWFVNIYPGPEIYELEGHSALRIKTCDYDMAINYGMFSFEQPGFVYRFVKGETDYMVGAIPWNYFIGNYIMQGRRIVAHRLDLSSQQKARLIDLVAENLLPQNREYRYNYVLDNCATRPLRMVELSVGDTLLLPEPSSATAPSLDTFREYMHFYHSNYPWYQFGIDLALGKGIDRKIDAREKSFAPVVLDNLMPGITVGSPEGRRLTDGVEVLNDRPEQAAILGATPWYLTPLFVFWFMAIPLTVYALTAVIRRRVFPRLLATIVFAVYGLAGLLVTFLVFVSVHESTSPNVNLLWLNPLCFVPTVCLWIKKAKKIDYIYFLINFVLLIALLILWLSDYQRPNAAFVPLVLTDFVLTVLYLYNYRKSFEKKYKIKPQS